jgi:hypothetical protein
MLKSKNRLLPTIDLDLKENESINITQIENRLNIEEEKLIEDLKKTNGAYSRTSIKV